MGLAPYGKPKYKKLILDKLIDIKEDGSFRLNMKYFNYHRGLTMISKEFIKLFKNNRRSEETKITQFHMDIASSIQIVIEEIMIKILKNISKKYKIDNLCLAGGVALNCVVNGKLSKLGLFKEIWVQPAAGDAGGSLGAALSCYYMKFKKERVLENTDLMQGSYLGVSYKNKEIENFINNSKTVSKFYNEDELLPYIAERISKGDAVGWFQGKMEYGPRALGNRSILADPRNEKMQKNLNLKIKFRESFRPFAPSILYENLNDWFDLNHDSPYMLFVGNILEKFQIESDEDINKGTDAINFKRSAVPAITHVDYTARIQTVHKNTNNLYYNLISEFYKITGVPMLINTSFNVRGEPIVCSPKDAIKCFLGTGLDILVMGNYVLLKKDQQKELLKSYYNQFKLD